MIGANVKIQDMSDRVAKAAERAALGNLRAAAFLVMTDARRSIDKSPQTQVVQTTKKTRRRGKRKRARLRRVPSPPGTPPHTRRGKLPRSILYDADKDSAFVGPAFSIVKTGGEPHEHGGQYKGGDYPERPFMNPALEQNISRFAGSFEGTIGE